MSSAYIIAEVISYTYRFAGVVAIEHNMALNIEADTSLGGDIINGARRLPNQITLSVVETDIHTQPGRSRSMLEAMDSIRRNRVLCKVVTSMGTYDRMLLSEITATQDEANQYGWAGDLVFMQYIPDSEQYYTETGSSGGAAAGSSSSSTRKTQNNSSTKKNTGTKAAVTSATAGVTAVLSRAGITTGAGGGALNFIIAK